MRKLPPLNHLRAFEAAARHESFKRAAEELHVTQAAISHLVKTLEEELGRQLFQRKVRGLRLAHDAREYAESLTRHFDGLEQATADLTGKAVKGTLRINCVPAFGYRFLLPAIDGFHQTFPDIRVDLTFEAGLTDLARDDFDAAIRYGSGSWPGLDTMLVQADELTPVCTKAFAADMRLPASAAEIAALPYAISPGGEIDWSEWCSSCGLDAVQRPAPLKLENRAVQLDYLLVGTGIGLTDLRFAAKELSDGSLVRLHDTTVQGVNATWLVMLPAPVKDPKLLLFFDWLKEEVGKIDTSSANVL